MIEALQDQLDREPLTAQPPELAPLPAGRAPAVRRALALLGGVASARAVAATLVEAGGPALTVRQVREALRGRSLTALGGGYFALPDAVERPILPWLRRRLERLGARPIDQVVDEIMARWPHGDPAAIAAWLRQDPSGVVVTDGLVHAPAQR